MTLVLFAGGGLFFAGCGKGGDGASGGADGPLDRYYEVSAGDFPITVLARGELDAIKNHNLRFEGVGKLGLRIDYIVEDKTELKSGDPVVGFSSEAYIEKITEYEESLHDLTVDYEEDVEDRIELFELQMRTLQESWEDARLNIDIFLDTQAVARDEALSKLAEASSAYESARDALNKYENLDYRAMTKNKQAAITNQEETYLEASEQLELANQNLSEARLKDDATREKAERNVAIAEKKAQDSLAAWETSRKAYRQFRRYEHPQSLRRLTIADRKTELNLKRALVKAQSDSVQANRRYRKLLRDQEKIEERIAELKEKYPEDLEKLETEYITQKERLTERLEETRSDLEGLVLTAPVDGLVTLGNPNQNNNRTPKELNIGTSVSPKEVVARIPDLSQFLVRCDIPEIYRSRIEKGQVARLKNAALPDLEMDGRVEEIASMSKRVMRWDPRSPRVYTTTISTDSTDPRLVPGMTVEIEILVETVEDAIFVPIEAIYTREGNSYCKVGSGFNSTEVEVETGRASNSFVEIIKGLEPGDSVFLQVEEANEGAS
ncbi:MAG: efflux RND transporter periplasmic adaptor subunit [Opitutales bacterium]